MHYSKDAALGFEALLVTQKPSPDVADHRHESLESALGLIDRVEFGADFGAGFAEFGDLTQQTSEQRTFVALRYRDMQLGHEPLAVRPQSWQRESGVRCVDLSSVEIPGQTSPVSFA